MVKLLAYDGTEENQRQGKLGKALHDSTKWAIRKGVDIAYDKYKDVYKYKLEHGWLKDHVAAMEEGWNWVMSLDEMQVNIGIGGFKGANDPNRMLFLKGSRIFFGIMDEDTHYDIRILLWLKWIHEHWDRFEQSAESAHQILNFGNLYKSLLALSEPLPMDDGSDEGYNINMVPLETKLKKGLSEDGEKE